MENPKSARLRLVGTGKRNLKKLLGRSESPFVAFAVPIQETVPAKKQTKSLGLRSHHGDILGVLKQMVDQSYDSDEDQEMAESWEEEVCETEPEEMDTQPETDTSGRSFIPCIPHQDPAKIEAPVAIHQVPSVHSVLRRKRKRTSGSDQTEKGEKHRSVPKDFVMPDFTSPAWAMEEVSTKMSSMDIADSNCRQRRSPSAPSKKSTRVAPDTLRRKQQNIFSTSATYDSCTDERPSKRKAIATPREDRTKPPVDLPLLHLADIPRAAALINSPDLSKACNIISPRSAFSRSPRRSPRSNSPGKSPLSPGQNQHQRSLNSPSSMRHSQSPLVSPSSAWTPRTSARLRMSDPIGNGYSHQNTN